MTPNIIMHPTRRNGIDSTKSFFGRVMMSVGWNGTNGFSI